jgi:hypothetical protein
MIFPEMIRHQLEGGVVRRSKLVVFNFLSGPKRVWRGFGKLRTVGGAEWDGIGDLGTIQGLQQSINGEAVPQTFSLSGVNPDLLAKAIGDPGEFYLRPVIVFQQYFTDKWQVLDSPFALSLRLMANIEVSMESDEQGNTYEITLTAESPFLNPTSPPNGYYTDRDQQTQFPGDRGLEDVATVAEKVITFPD